MVDGTSSPNPSNGGPQTPLGFVADIAKKDGVIGVFLLLLCYFIWSDKKDDRADRERWEKLAQNYQQQVMESHAKTVEVATRSAEAVKQATTVIDQTRVVISRVERRLDRQAN